MTFDWRRKAAAFRLFERLPGGLTLYYLTQRYITRTFPRALDQPGRWAMAHAAAFRRWWGPDLSGARLYEFGAGWDLFNNLVQWCYGVNRQVVIDLRRWARSDQINHAIHYLRGHPPAGAVRVPERLVTRAFDRDLDRWYGVDYRAPADARHTPLPDASTDLVCTTSVLEHVPAAALEAILRETARLCRPHAISSHVVDYSDHYAHSDPAITIYNFLRFSEEEWQPYNPDLHSQNRLRHHEYGELFGRTGFDLVDVHTVAPPDADTLLTTLPLHERFQRMPAASVGVRTGHWVLKKR